MERGRWRIPCVVVALVFFVGVGPAKSQEVSTYRALVVDAQTGDPIENVYVFASATQTMGLSAADGRFQMQLPVGPQRLLLSRIGYGESEVVVIVGGNTLQTIRISPSAAVLPGIEVEGRSFQARLDSIEVELDRSANGERMYQGFGARGVPRFASVERIRQYDDAADPTFAFGALGVPNILFDDFCGVRVQGRAVSPTLFIDGEMQDFLGCDRFREMKVSEICRMELIPQPRLLRRNDLRFYEAIGTPSHDLYIWSCRFMARLATGDAAIPDLFDVAVPTWWTVGGR